MNTRHYDEAEAGRLLRTVSTEYDDLPQAVADRLDRVLEQLPGADTLHAGEEHAGGRWSERLRARGFRYALMSATAALLVTVGAVAAAVQIVSTSAGDDESSVITEQHPNGAFDEGDPEGENGAEPEAEDFAADEETQAEAPSGAEETGNVEIFASGSDYSEQTDLLTALRDLGADGPTGTVPEELTGLADSGTLWRNCQEAIASWYDSLIVAVDFARFDSEPAVLALLVTDSGERAVAVTPECANGTVVEIFAQE